MCTKSEKSQCLTVLKCFPGERCSDLCTCLPCAFVTMKMLAYPQCVLLQVAKTNHGESRDRYETSKIFVTDYSLRITIGLQK